MANPDHLAILKQGLIAWNAWRDECPGVIPDLGAAELSGQVLAWASLSAGGIIRPVVTNGVSHVGDGSASQGFPDGTNARRMQAALRFTF